MQLEEQGLVIKLIDVVDVRVEGFLFQLADDCGHVKARELLPQTAPLTKG